MKFIRLGLIPLLMLASAAAFADAAPNAATASQPAAAMPCGRMQANCPQAGQPMGRGNMRNGMGPGMGQGMGPGMRQGMMGQGKPAAPQNPPPRKYKKAPAASGKDVIYGSQLMTPQERAAYREKIRNAKTAEERARIRAEHHKEMQERAKQQGKTLPPAPPPI